MDPNNNQPTNPILNPNPTPAPETNPASGAIPAPVENPVINSFVNDPVAQESVPANPVIDSNANLSSQGDLVNPVIQPSGGDLAATDPIMKPEPAPAPDPIEEELKAPMKANGPVPGSIGSAVSGPENTENTGAGTPVDNPFSSSAPEKATNVSFNDPAAQPEGVQPNANSNAPKKKTNKTTLIALIAVIAVIIIVLVVVLIMQSTSNNKRANYTPNTEVAEEIDYEDIEEVDEGEALSCTRAMDDEELKKNNNAKFGSVKVNAEFNEAGTLTAISMTESVVDENSNKMTEISTKGVILEDTEDFKESDYSLVADTSGEVDLSFDSIKKNYESLDFTCEVL